MDQLIVTKDHSGLKESKSYHDIHIYDSVFDPTTLVDIKGKFANQVNMKGVGKKRMLMINIWNFSKVYISVEKQEQTKNKDIIWKYPSETHVTDGKVNKKYWKWRKRGMTNKHAILKPNDDNKSLYTNQGIGDSAEYHLWKGSRGKWKKYPLIEARKILCKLYGVLIKDLPEFKKAQDILNKGGKIRIIDKDGPNDGDYNLIINKSLSLDEDAFKHLINQKKKFCYGYILGMYLLKEDWTKDKDDDEINDVADDESDYEEAEKMAMDEHEKVDEED